MSGHSHWSGIKYKKAKEDAKRGKAFSRCARAVMTAVREGGKDPDTNLQLKYAIEAAKAVNMPKDNIERAVLKGAGELEGQNLAEIRYEGYGPGGAAVMVETLTDNRNRTTAHIRKIFDTRGGQLGTNGCVAWTFETKGLIMLAANDKDEEEMFELALEAGAEDIERAGDVYELTCDARELQIVKESLQAAGLGWESAEITQVPKSYVDLSVKDGQKVLKMMEGLEADEDVTAVYSNFNLPEELVAELRDE